MSDFGARLKEARNRMGMTQKDLSTRLGIAQSTVANYEKNTRFPGETILREISESLNTSTDHLLGMDEVDARQTEDKREVEIKDIDKFLEYLIGGKGDSARLISKELHGSGVPLTDLIQNLFVPVLQRIGTMWESGIISVAQEHYSTVIITSLIDYLSEIESINPNKKYTAIFMVPGDEEHVLSLRMVSEFFREAGWKIIFIGKSIPYRDFKDALDSSKVDLVVLSAFSSRSLNSSAYLITAIKGEMGSKAPLFLLGGRGVESQKAAFDAGSDFHLNDLNGLYEMIIEIENIL